MPKYIEKEYLEECNNKDITHVVTSVTYGLDANFVFKYLMSGITNLYHWHSSLIFHFFRLREQGKHLWYVEADSDSCSWTSN